MDSHHRLRLPANRPGSTAPGDGNLHQIERLAELHKTGILSSEESTTNKAELLSRL
jgi:hypothetical protein